jgi:hypothetical protein
MFVSPEMARVDDQEDAQSFDRKAGWDVAVRFQDLKRLGNISDKQKEILKRQAIRAIIQRARALMRAVGRPKVARIMDQDELRRLGLDAELDVENTLEANPLVGKNPISSSFLYEARVDRKSKIALVMDASLSMTGEKIALLAVAVAVVGLTVPSEQLSLMGFDSRIRWIKKFGIPMSVEGMIEGVLSLPAGGFTNIELALSETVATYREQLTRGVKVVLIGDGKYTEGQDPTALASSFSHLSAIKVGRDQAGRTLLIDLCARGRGELFEARRSTDLPSTMYQAIRVLLR